MRNPEADKTDAFDKRLRAYAAGAGAAAAGLLAFAPPAPAEIVVVPAHATLGYDSGFRIDIEGTTALTFIDKFRRSSSGYCVTASLVGECAFGCRGDRLWLAAARSSPPQVRGCDRARTSV